MIRYEASIFADTAIDDYKNGESLERVGVWEETVKAKTKEDLIKKIEDVTGVERRDWNVENLNDYEYASEVFADILVNENNHPARDAEIKLWKKGKITLWAMHFHILISQVEYKPCKI